MGFGVRRRCCWRSDPDPMTSRSREVWIEAEGSCPRQAQVGLKDRRFAGLRQSAAPPPGFWGRAQANLFVPGGALARGGAVSHSALSFFTKMLEPKTPSKHPGRRGASSRLCRNLQQPILAAFCVLWGLLGQARCLFQHPTLMAHLTRLPKRRQL